MSLLGLKISKSKLGCSQLFIVVRVRNSLRSLKHDSRSSVCLLLCFNYAIGWVQILEVLRRI